MADLDQPQAAARQRVQDRGRRRAGGEAGPAAGERDVARGARQHPFETLQIGVDRIAGEQRVRARIARGIVLRLHRQIEQDLMSGATGALDPALQTGGVDRKLQAEFAGQADRRLGQLGLQTQPHHQQRDPRPAVSAVEGPRMGEERALPRRSDSGRRSEAALLAQGRRRAPRPRNPAPHREGSAARRSPGPASAAGAPARWRRAARRRCRATAPPRRRARRPGRRTPTPPPKSSVAGAPCSACSIHDGPGRPQAVRRRATGRCAIGCCGPRTSPPRAAGRGRARADSPRRPPAARRPRRRR